MLRRLLYYFKKYPFIVWFALITFIAAFSGVGAFLMPFYKSNNLSNTQILLLQSIFLITATVAEIPTGVLADKIGRKISVLTGNLTYSLGMLFYFLGKNFYIFAAAEILMGTGRAFNSGADEALLYDSLKEHKLTKQTNTIYAYLNNILTIGAIIYGFLSIFLLKIFTPRQMWFLVFCIFNLETLILSLKIKEPNIQTKREFAPKYIDILKRALKILKKRKILLRFFLLGLLLMLTSYWSAGWILDSYWLYLGITASTFATTRIVSRFLSLIYNNLWPFFHKKFGYKKLILINQSIGYFLLIAGTLIAQPFHLKIVAISFTLIAAIFLNGAENLIFYDMQKIIPSKYRATINSFYSLFTSLTLGILNPLVGHFADLSLIFTITGLPLIFIIFTIIILVAKNKT